LKASTTHRYLLGGKSVHDKLNPTMTYGECCQRYLNVINDNIELHMICPKCCHDLQQIYALHHDAEQLIEKIRHTWHKTKRLNRARDKNVNMPINHQKISQSSISTKATSENFLIAVKEEVILDDNTVPVKPNHESSMITAANVTLADIPHVSFDVTNCHRTYSSKVNQRVCCIPSIHAVITFDFRFQN
jgi:hypothetical protein